MSSTAIQSLAFASKETIIYIGFFALVSGILGNILNIIIFTSLKTFRETSCAFYLTIASTVNILHILATLLSRILIAGYNIDLTQTSLVLCKLRQFFALTGPIIAFSCMCFATIDQFLSLTIRWRHLSHRNIAWRLTVFSIIFCCLHGIPVIIFYDNIFSSATGTWSCAITNPTYALYFNRFYIPFLLGFIPLTIRTIFGLLAFISVRSLTNRQIPIVRLERDKQLTSMVLIQTVVDVILSLPFFIYYTYTSYTTFTDPFQVALYQLILTVTNIAYYLTFAIGFYIYFCSSSRFRKQLIYVLIEVHIRYWFRGNAQRNNNRIAPQLNESHLQPAPVQSITQNG